MKKFFLLLVGCSIVLSTMTFAQGYSLQFNGVNNYVDCLSGGIGNNPSAITQEAWVKTSALNGPILSKRHADDGSDWPVLMIGDGKPYTFASDKSYGPFPCAAYTNILDGLWHHVASTRDGNQYKIFVDGKLENTLTDNHVMGGSPYNFHIGHDGSWITWFTGLISEVRVWNRALTEAEIKSKMFSYLVPAQETGLVGYWKFNEGTGTTATDLAGTNNGIINGATWVLDRPTTLSDGLVSYYPFNGDANDESGNGNNGTVNGATLTTDRFGNENKAFSFNGSSNYILLPTNSGSLSGSTAFTMQAWVLRKNSTQKTIFNHWISLIGYSGVPVGVQLTPISYSMIGGQGTDIRDTNDYKVNKWNHIILTYNGADAIPSNRAHYFINGVEIPSGATSQTVPSQIGSVSNVTAIGASSSPIGYTWFFTGSIDDIRIYNRVLSNTEIQLLFNEGDYSVAPSTPMNLLATVGNSQVILTWNKVADTDVKRYRIYRNTSSPASTQVDSTFAGNLNDTTKTITGLTNGQSYYFRITAVDSAGNESPYSNEVSAVPSTSVLPSAGLVAYYPFYGNANDSSGNGNNGTIYGATLTTNRFGMANNAYYFSNSYIQANINTSSIQSAVTISLWALRVGNGTIGPRMLEFYDPSVNGSSQWNWDNANYTNYGSVTSTGNWITSTFVPKPNNTWTHLVYTNDSMTGRFYQDGVLINSVASTGKPILAGNVAFGRMNHPAYDAFNGKLDDVRIYNRALSTSEVQLLFNEGGWSNLNQGLVAYYPFSGNAHDSSGNGNNGTVTDATLTIDRFGNANKAYMFDGTSSFISVPDNDALDLTGDFSVSSWINATSFKTNQIASIVTKHNININQGSYCMGTWPISSNDNEVGFQAQPFANASTYPGLSGNVNINTWNHYVTTFTKSTSQLNYYLNNVLIFSKTLGLAITNTTENLLIGASNGNSGKTFLFSGSIDDIRIYNRVLTVTEIQSLYTEGQTVDTSTTTTWRMQIQSQIASLSDIENFAGVSDNATDGQDASYDKAEPPTSIGNYISLYFPHAEWNSILGNNFAKDIKKNTALADTVKRWYFQVQSNVINDTVTLTFTNDRIPTSFGKYLTDLKTGKRVNLKNTSLYKYFNTSDTARSFMVIIGDSTAPSLSLNAPNGSNIWRSGTNKNIIWSTSDGTGVDSIFVYSSSNAGTSYSLLKSLSLAQSTSWTLPNEYLNNNYSIKISVRDSLGNKITVKSAKTFTIVGDSLATSNNAGWSLISVPITPKDSSLSSIFDNASYLWTYTQSTLYKEPTAITLGNGYWLGVSATKNWYIKGTANETDSSVQTLQLGYNIIGNNFVRNVSKNSLFCLKSGAYYSFSTAVTAGLISNTLYGYSSSAYSSVDTMSLFGGYWIGVLQSGVQLIQKTNVSILTPLAKKSQILATNWELPIKLSTVTLADDIAMIGIKQNSTSGFDVQYDAPRPPRNPGSNYLEIYFTNTGGNYPAILGSKYAKDFRDSSSANWNFTIENSQNNDVTLSWDKTLLEGLAGSLQLILKDNFNSAIVDMKQVGSYTFTYSTLRLFSINAKITSVGKNKENLPTEFSLSQNYPNPFNPTTTLRYGVPERSTVRFSVYNTLGQQVAQLFSGTKDVGFYEYSFDASKLSSGIYLYKIEAISEQNPNKIFITTKKMVMMK